MDAATTMKDTTMSFWEHVAELRWRLLVAALAMVAGTVACFFFVEPAATFIMRPVGDMQFVFLSPPELFMSYVKLALIGGIVIASPVILFQLWLFVRPGLSKRERLSLVFGLIFGAIFFAAGATFSFFVIIPFSLRFFLQYQNEAVKAMFSFSEYVGFIGSMVLSFGAAFELPIVVSILAGLGVLTGTALAKARGVGILLIFIAAAIITPPDIVSQVLLGLPMVALFELSIMLAKGQERRRARRLDLEA
ncbi:MAG: twin-arginine translocase subunit TatC [Spirochaetae bacterium HGW-Spirochaetae-7]|jgi:sec-independent protein translocase protein TatC|nr:MAG: twin-arginine translocase subunit TatC [Spirochaetae bacterium HGW-Spirochaetae-7]